MDKLTQSQMAAAWFAHATQIDAKTQKWTVDEVMQSLHYDPDMRAEYAIGAELLKTWKPSVSKRTTIYPFMVDDNQIVDTAGYIATSEAFVVITFTPTN